MAMWHLPRRSLVLKWLLAATAAACALALALPIARAVPVQAGYRDFAWGGSGSPVSIPTADKPQSKLWWNDGRWWGVLYNRNAAAFRIYWLDLATQSWKDTGVLVDTRPTARADALWDGSKLYIVSGTVVSSEWGSPPSPEQLEQGSAELLRFSYDVANKQYHLDGGFPITVRQGSSESLTLAKDSTGQLWITYTRDSKVWINRSLDKETTWGQPFTPPVSGASVHYDDISAVVAFGGNKIGLMWSNQNDKKFYFTVHRDGDPDDVWESTKVVYGGGNLCTGGCANDHLNLKQLISDGSGRVYAVVKTAKQLDDQPFVVLLVRDGVGTWKSYTFGRVQDQHTRPILLIDEEHRRLYIFATAPEEGGAIYYKSTSIDSIAFPVGLGTSFIQSSLDPQINNPTSTKQNVNGTTGLVVLASDNSTHFYLHNYLNLSNTMTFTPSADTYVSSDSPTTNFGSAPILSVDASPQKLSFLKFSVTGLGGTVTSARLRLFVRDRSSSGGSVSSTSDTGWSESSVTYEDHPAVDGPVLATLDGVDKGEWVEFDVSRAVAGNGTVAFVLQSRNKDGADYASREDTGHRPQLVVMTAP